MRDAISNRIQKYEIITVLNADLLFAICSINKVMTLNLVNLSYFIAL